MNLEIPNSLYYTEEDIAQALSQLVKLNPSIEAEQKDWFRLADSLKMKLDMIATLGDFERHRFHYAIYFVSEGQKFSRHADYYEQEREKIIHNLCNLLK